MRFVRKLALHFGKYEGCGLHHHFEITRLLVGRYRDRLVKIARLSLHHHKAKLLGLICRQALLRDENASVKVIFLAGENNGPLALRKDFRMFAYHINPLWPRLALKKVMVELRTQYLVNFLEMFE